MGLQWAILAYVVATEAAIAVILTLPAPKLVRTRIVSVVSSLLQPAGSVIPFAAFQIMDLYWKKEHRLNCTSEVCTSSEMIHYEKSIYKAQRNAIMCVMTCFLYWCIYRVCKYHKKVNELEAIEKRLKAL